MCIYCGTKYYRKIYESHNGPIPNDSDGRSYEIHHIDGNKHNNELNNLKCVSIQEHYEIHYSQKDWAACLRIAKRANISVEKQSQLASNAAIIRNKNDSYINPFKRRSDGSSVSGDRAAKGTHQYLKRKDGTSMSSDRVKNKTHNFITNHPNKKIVTCPHCGISGGSTNMVRFHFSNCWENPSKDEIQRTVFKCIHCNLETNIGNYKRWHGKNCKHARNKS